jgi:hypothetical protein
MMDLERARKVVEYMPTLCNYIATEEDDDLRVKAMTAMVRLSDEWDETPAAIRAEAVRTASTKLSEPLRIRSKTAGCDIMLVPDNWKIAYDIPTIPIGQAVSMTEQDVKNFVTALETFDGEVVL